MDKFEEYIKARYPVDYEHLKEKYPNVPVGEFYGDEKDLWNYRQAEVDELQNRLIAVQRLLDEKFALVYDGKGYFSDMVKCDDLDQALKGSHYEEHHTKAEQQINKGARLTKHQIDLGDKNANS